MIQFVYLLIEGKGIARRFGNSITDALCAIEARRIEAGRSFLGCLLVDSGMPDRESHYTRQNKATKESCCTKSHDVLHIWERRLMQRSLRERGTTPFHTIH
jgi:hypothetical protein